MDNVALVSPNTFNFELRNKFGIKILKFQIETGKPFALPRQVAEQYLMSDPGNFQLYNGEEKPVIVPFVPMQAYEPPPSMEAEPEPENKLPVEVEIFLKDLLAENPKVHLDMILAEGDAPSILTDPNITIEHARLVADKLEVPYTEEMDKEKLDNRIIEVVTARLDNE